MRTSEKIFILAVAVVALIFCAITLSHTRDLLVQSALESAAPAPGSAGTPRTLDLNQIKQMIRQKNLSNHEADFYKKLPIPEKP